MPNTLKGVKIGGQPYHFDHDYLDNNPLPDNLSESSNAVRISEHVLTKTSDDELIWKRAFPSVGDEGDVLAVGGSGNLEWKSIESGGGSGGLPDYESLTSEHVLVADGSVGLQWMSPDELPTNYERIPTAGCEWGTVLMNLDDGGANWYSTDKVFPEFDDNDEGKVLMIQDGVIAWGNPS